MKQYKLIIAILIWLPITACEDFLDKEPVDSITDQSAIKDLNTAKAALFGLYNLFYSDPRGNGSLSDEQNEAIPGALSTNTLLPEDAGSWRGLYEPIHTANNIIQKVPLVNTIPIEQKAQIIAEAKCIRALNYLIMMQFYGDIPWTESTDYRVNERLSRTPMTEIYANIISDVLEAEQTLPLEYASNDETRTRFTKGAATALLSRIYLYNGNWAEAQAKSTDVINNPLYQLQGDYQTVFTKNSPESILELWSDIETHVGPARSYLPVSLGGFHSVFPTNKIENAFEDGDLRKEVVLGTSLEGLLYINKYKDAGLTGDFQEIKVFRLAEIYLIRAEARAKQNDLTGAVQDLNIIRNRAGLLNHMSTDQISVLLAIEQERFVELCFEGHRWIDLVRTARVDEVMAAFNPTTWLPRASLLPIPQIEIDRNPNLAQNPGY